jgi:hypothetical protein
MVQRLLDDKFIETETGDFSSLAWRFNNLNSTAKMLLVGASPSSVPFIPLSELANENNSLTLSSPAQHQGIANPLSISTLVASNSARPVVQQQSIKTKNEVYQDIKFSAFPVNPADLALDEQTNSRANASKKLIIDPKPILSNQKLAQGRPLLTQRQNQAAYSLPTASPEPLQYNQSNDAAVWGYQDQSVESDSAEEESDYFSLKEELSRRHLKVSSLPPFLKTTAKTITVLSLIGLLGFGAYNLLRRPFSSKDNEIDKTLNEADPLNTDPDTDSNTTDPFADPVSKDYVHEDLSNTTSSSSYNPSPTKSTFSYSTPKRKTSYRPKFQPQPKFQDINQVEPQIQRDFDPSTVYDSSAEDAIKPSTYTPEEFPIEISYVRSSEQVDSFQTYSGQAASLNQLDSSQTFAPALPESVNQSPRQIINQDPGQLDSEEQTYNQQSLESPQSVSAVQGVQQQDQTVDPNNEALVDSGYSPVKMPPSAGYSNFEQSGGEAQPLTGSADITTTPASVPAQEANSTFYSGPRSVAQPINPSVGPATDSLNPTIQQSNIAAPVNNSFSNSSSRYIPQDLDSELTQEERALLNPNFAPNQAYKNTVQPNKPQLYTKPISQIEELQNAPSQTGFNSSSQDINEDGEFSVPIMRQPLRSSGNSVQTNTAVGSASSSTFAPKKYILAKRGKVSRFDDGSSNKTFNSRSRTQASSAGAYESQIANIRNTAAADGDLNEKEKAILLKEVETLKQEIIKGNYRATSPGALSQKHLSKHFSPYSHSASSQQDDQFMASAEADNEINLSFMTN